jgi:hypothetical protein
MTLPTTQEVKRVLEIQQMGQTLQQANDTLSRIDFFATPAPTYSEPFPSEFSEMDKRTYKPIKTSYYTAWVAKKEENWIHPFLENNSDSPIMKEARKIFHSHGPILESLSFELNHQKEYDAVSREYLLAKKERDPFFMPCMNFVSRGSFRIPLATEEAENRPITSKSLCTIENIFKIVIILVALVVIGGIVFYCARFIK